MVDNWRLTLHVRFSSPVMISLYTTCMQYAMDGLHTSVIYSRAIHVVGSAWSHFTVGIGWVWGVEMAILLYIFSCCRGSCPVHSGMDLYQSHCADQRIVKSINVNQLITGMKYIVLNH